LKTIIAIRIGTAAVWFTFGLVFKVFDAVPRHRLIVASVLGEDLARPATMLIGVAETVIGIWILTGFRPRVCAALQTVALASMNTLELCFARHQLLSPIFMICANIVFLGVVWYGALRFEKKLK
jgi:uncharacterized membrane protein YphA (DoxX/SURF4 family)